MSIGRHSLLHVPDDQVQGVCRLLGITRNQNEQPVINICHLHLNKLSPGSLTLCQMIKPPPAEPDDKDIQVISDDDEGATGKSNSVCSPFSFQAEQNTNLPAQPTSPQFQFGGITTESAQISRLEYELVHTRLALFQRVQQIEHLSQRAHQLETTNQHLYNHLVLNQCRYREQEARFHHQLYVALRGISFLQSAHKQRDSSVANNADDTTQGSEALAETSDCREGQGSAKRAKYEPASGE